MFFRRRNGNDFQREIQAHLSMETDRLVADGMDPQAARAAARKHFGNVLAAEERFHEHGHWLWLEQLRQDARYGWRSLCHSPAFLTTTVLSLSLGISLIVILFATFNAYVLRPFAVREPYSLYQLGWSSPQGKGDRFSWSDFQELRSRRDLFDEVLAERTTTADSAGRTLVSAFVSERYFDELGLRLELGRTPEANEEAVVLSDDAWSRLFQRDAGAIGKTIELGRRKLTVTGVLRPEFTGLDDSPRDLWAPLSLYRQLTQVDLLGPAQPRLLKVTARLRRDMTESRVQSALVPFMSSRFSSASVTPIRPEVTQQATPVRLTLELIAALAGPFLAFFLVLLTACANVSNMMLARANARFREISVRLSIGASRGRLVRQLLTEGLLISLLASGIGLALASLGLQSGVRLFMGALPPSAAAVIRVIPLEFDHRVLLFTLTAAFVTTLLFALAPALHAAKVSLTDALRGQGGDTRRGSRLRSALVGGQVMAAMVLLVATITMARNAMTLGSADFGLDRTNVVTVRPRMSEGTLLANAAAELEANAHIQSVAVASIAPLSEATDRVALQTRRGAETISAPLTYVSSRYFEALRIPILRGRGFTREESESEAKVAVVSASAARALWPQEDPVGQLIHSGNDAQDAAVVVGVVPDVVSSMVFAGADAGHVYYPINAASKRATVALARGRSAQDIRPAVTQSILQRIHPEPTAFSVISLEESLALQMFPIRVVVGIGSVLGFVALALSLSGLYGVLSYALAQRTREVGIRVALGAGPGTVMKLILAQSARLAGLGAGIGLVVAMAVMKALSSVPELRGIVSLEVSSFTLSVLLVLGATLLATLVPACRAIRIDPGKALRVDN